MNYKPEIVRAYFLQEGLPNPVFEYVYIPNRRFRLDIAFPSYKVGMEVEGGIWIRGKHGRGSGVKKDMIKNNMGLIHGWRVLRIEPKEICTQEVIDMLKMLLCL